jgi:hypothetical protein
MLPFAFWMGQPQVAREYSATSFRKSLHMGALDLGVQASRKPLHMLCFHDGHGYHHPLGSLDDAQHLALQGEESLG